MVYRDFSFSATAKAPLRSVISTSDFDTQILGISGESITIRTLNNTLDTYGKVKSTSIADNLTTALIRPINAQDRELQSGGYIPRGEYVGYFKTSDSIRERQLILYGDITLEVTGIPDKKKIGDVALCDKAYLKVVEDD